DAREGEALLLVVDVDAVERDVRLVAARAVDRARALVVVGVVRVRLGDAGLEAEQVDDVAPLDRQLPDLGLAERVADRGILAVDRLAARYDLDRLAHRT